MLPRKVSPSSLLNTLEQKVSFRPGISVWLFVCLFVCCFFLPCNTAPVQTYLKRGAGEASESAKNRDLGFSALDSSMFPNLALTPSVSRSFSIIIIIIIITNQWEIIIIYYVLQGIRKEALPNYPEEIKSQLPVTRENVDGKKLRFLGTVQQHLPRFVSETATEVQKCAGSIAHQVAENSLIIKMVLNARI